MRPAAGWELQNMLLPMIDRQMSVEIVGSGSKRAIGRPFQAAAQLTTAAMQGIWLYEPTELVMSAQAGTPLTQVEATLASNGQMLSFEPIDLGPTTGGPRGTQTIGSIFASNSSGSRRITAGAARDNLLGIEAVNGRA